MSAVGVTPDVIHVMDAHGLELRGILQTLRNAKAVPLVFQVERAPRELHLLLVFGRALEQLEVNERVRVIARPVPQQSPVAAPAEDEVRRLVVHYQEAVPLHLSLR